jgi:hypothetical protein
MGVGYINRKEQLNDRTDQKREVNYRNSGPGTHVVAQRQVAGRRQFTRRPEVGPENRRETGLCGRKCLHSPGCITGSGNTKKIGSEGTTAANVRQGAGMAATTAKMSKVTRSALETLRSVDFLLQLGGALRRVGLHGQDELMALGAYFVAISRFQAYPLKAQINERTEGTAAFIVKKLSGFVLADDVIKITPAGTGGWNRLAGAPDRKVVFIPRWTKETESGPVRFDAEANKIIRITPLYKDDRVVVRVEELEGRFACISVERPQGWVHKTRWLSMTQAVGEQVAGEPPIISGSEPDFAMWRGVERLLQERARIPIVLPEWEQALMELANEKGNRAMEMMPTLLQTWRTMVMIRSFQSPANDSAGLLSATFEDLAAAMLFARKIFREAGWFPSCKKLFNALPQLGFRTGLLHPLSGKGVSYTREIKKVTIQERSALDWDTDQI